MARPVRGNPESRPRILEGSEQLTEREAIRNAFRPSRAQALPAPHGGATRPVPAPRTRPKAKRGPSKTQREQSSMGPGGRARARVGATKHGKLLTEARTAPARSASRGGKSKPVRGSPKAKRRIANRRAVR